MSDMMSSREYCYTQIYKKILLNLFIVLFTNGALVYTNWIEMNSTGHRYKLFLDREPYRHARDDCEDIGATLAIVKNGNENAFVQSLIPSDLEYDVWIGLHRESFSLWKFVDGSTYDEENYDSNPWQYGEPDMFLKYCTAISKYGYWYNTYCGTYKYYLCQIVQTSTETTVAVTEETSVLNGTDITTVPCTTDITTVPGSTDVTTVSGTTAISTGSGTTTITTVPDITDVATLQRPSMPMRSTESSLAKCVCSCVENNITVEEYLSKFFDEIKKHLVVDKTMTSQNLRKLNSVSDERKSSEQIGFVGIVLICLPILIIVTLDLFPRA